MSGRRRILSSSFAAVFTAYVCFQNLVPLYPAVAHDLRITAAELGAIVASASLVSVALQVPTGVLADRYGRRLFLALGMLALIVTQLLRWRASTPAALVLAQVVAGVCLGFTSLNAMASVSEAYRDFGRSRAMGILNTAVNSGQVLGYLFAGALGGVLGWRTISLLTAGAPVIALGLIATSPEPPRSPTRSSIGRELLVTLRVLVRPELTLLAIVAAETLAVGQGAAYLLPFVLATQHFGPSTASLLLLPYVAGSVAGAPLAGALADRYGTHRLIRAWLGVGTGAVVLFALAPRSIPITVVSYLLIGAAVNSCLPLIAVEVLNTVAARYSIGAGAALGGLRLGQSLGPAVGPALAGYGLERLGQQAAPLVLALSSGCALGLFSLLTAIDRRRRPVAPRS